MGLRTSLPCLLFLFVKERVQGDFQCNFDADFCGWTQDTGDDFDWERNQRPYTPTTKTGPDFDHTSGKGHYAYIETSKPRIPKDAARLVSQEMHGSTWCLTFWYHMYGSSLGHLNVYTRENKFQILGTLVSTRSGPSNQSWLQANVTIRNSVPIKVVIEATRGLNYFGDIAIDDISFFNGVCATGAPQSRSYELPTISYRNESASVAFDVAANPSLRPPYTIYYLGSGGSDSPSAPSDVTLSAFCRLETAAVSYPWVCNVVVLEMSVHAAGTYAVSVGNSQGAQLYMFNVSYYRKPSLDITYDSKTDSTVKENATVTLTCGAISRPVAIMTVHKDGVTSPISSGQSPLNLTFDQARCTDAGVYVCSGSNRFGQSDSKASRRLYVKCSPRSMSTDLPTINNANEASVTFDVTAYPLPRSPFTFAYLGPGGIDAPSPPSDVTLIAWCRPKTAALTYLWVCTVKVLEMTSEHAAGTYTVNVANSEGAQLYRFNVSYKYKLPSGANGEDGVDIVFLSVSVALAVVVNALIAMTSLLVWLCRRPRLANKVSEGRVSAPAHPPQETAYTAKNHHRHHKH